MKPTGNKDLDAVLRMREADTKERSKRYAVLRWVLAVDFYETQDKARDVLARMPVGRRGGLVDRETGDTWVNRKNFNSVMACLRKKRAAPKHFRRVGQLGPIKPKRGKPRGPYQTRSRRA